ncbi:hypothetical protein OH492_10180 [Vibrio chagasii]|nr:hypothetical protein [Vibrio chagasii]
MFAFFASAALSLLTVLRHTRCLFEERLFNASNESANGVALSLNPCRNCGTEIIRSPGQLAPAFLTTESPSPAHRVRLSSFACSVASMAFTGASLPNSCSSCAAFGRHTVKQSLRFAANACMVSVFAYTALSLLQVQLRCCLCCRVLHHLIHQQGVFAFTTAAAS